MLRSLLVFIFLIGSYLGFSQDINWPQAIDEGDLNATDEIVSCEGSVIANNQGDYNLENISYQLTICPDDEDAEDDLIVFLSDVSVTWPQGLGANPNFFFRVHDGDSTADPVIANSTPQNAGIPSGIVANDNSETGCLTIVFNTGGSGVPGFPVPEFGISFDFGCRLPCQTIIPQLISIEADEFCSDEDAETPTFAPGTEITFTADAFTSNNSNFDDLTFEWNFNGNILTGSEVTTSFTTPGLIVGTLTVIDEFLCESEPLSVNVIVGDEILSVSPQDEAYSLDELIADVMVGGGECANVNNIEALRESPNGTSIGYFSRGCSDFPFNEGLVIGSGGVQEITGEPGAENGWWGAGTPNGSEENLLAIVGGNPGNSVNDATVIEFEFSSFESTVSFDYIYASQEYTSSYPCSYADPFAFIISGPGIEDEYEYIPDGNPANQEFQDLGGFNVATITPVGLDAPMPTTATNIHPGAPFNCGAGSLGEFFYPEFFNTLGPPYHQINGETNRLTAEFEVIPCETYTLKLMVADWNDTILNSFVFIEGGSFNIGADLGDDITVSDDRVICWGEDRTQTLEIFGGSLDANCEITLEWFKDGVYLPEFDGMASIEVSESGVYEVFVGGDGSCNDSDSILVQFLPQAEYENPFQDFSICDDTGSLPGGLPAALNPFDYLAHNGIGEDIPEDAESMADLGFEVTYFENFEDAENFENPIENPEEYALPGGNFINTICVRVNENFTGDRQCPTIECFDLISFEEPEIQETEDLIQCGDFSPASQVIDLTQNNPTSLGVQEPGIVEAIYFNTEADALANENPIENPANFILPPDIEQQTIFVRVQNTGSEDCFDVASFEAGVYNVEIGTNPLPFIEACEEDGQGNGTFNLTQQNSLVLGENQISQNYSISYFEDLADANGGVNPINQPSEYFGGAGNIFVRIQNNNNPDCFEVGQFEISIIESAAVNLEVGPIEACDNNNDGFFHEFDLDVLVGDINFTNNPDLEVTFHPTIQDAESGQNVLPSPYASVTENQTIFIRAEDTESGCIQTAPLELIIYPSPLLETPEPLALCDDNETGVRTFDLTLVEDEVLVNIDNPNNFDIAYYNNENGAINQNPGNLINNPNGYESQSNEQTVFIRVTDPNSPIACFNIVPIELRVDPLPDIIDPERLSVCDDETGGSSTNEQATFDLFSKVPEITQGDQTILVNFYEDEALQNQITDTENFVNTQNPQVVYVEAVDLDTDCTKLTTLTLEVIPEPSIPELEPLVECDPGNNGFAEFDLGAVMDDIIGNEVDVEISFHETEQEAFFGTEALATEDEDGNAILYENFNPFSQTIFVRAINTGTTNQTETDCFIVRELELIVEPSPVIQDFDDLRACSDNPNIAVFDLTQNSSAIIGNQENVTLTYHQSLANAENGTNAIAFPVNYNGIDGEFIYIRLEGENGCITAFNSAEDNRFQLFIDDRPEINLTASNEIICASPSDAQAQDNEIGEFDLTQKDGEINPNAGDPNTEVVYYASEADFEAGIPITNPENFFTSQSPQTIYAEVVNTDNECPSSTQVTFDIIVNPLPLVDISNMDGSVICIDRETGEIVSAPTLDTGLNANDFEFEWFLDGEELDFTGSALTVEDPGFYEVIVIDVSTSNTTACERSSFAEVIESSGVQFEVNILSSAFDGSHSIEITNIEGNGEFEFSVDGGPWVAQDGQPSLVFSGLEAGEVEIIGRDLGGCDEEVKIISLIDYPKFFTPNNDGFNDSWNIIGLANQTNAKIYIFDRYGKLLKQLSPSSQGWDGTYNGKPMPSNDYWFQVEYTEPRTGSRKTFKSNFTLKR